MLYLHNQPVVISRAALVNVPAIIVVVIVWIIIRIVPGITEWISEIADEEDMAVMMMVVPIAAVYS